MEGKIVPQILCDRFAEEFQRHSRDQFNQVNINSDDLKTMSSVNLNTQQICD